MGTPRTDFRNCLRRLVPLVVAVLALPTAIPAEDAHFAGSWLDDDGDLRGAFKEVVQAAQQATVRILSDEKTIRLGAIVDADGWIVTKGSDLTGTLRCRLPDGRELPIEQRAYDLDSDLALFRVAATGLTPIRWKAGADPVVGDWLATCGQDSRPVAVGIVSVRRRKITAEKISGVLGVRLEDLDGVAQIKDVVAESAAANAELQRGDVIMRVADKTIDSRESLVRLIRQYEPGTTLDITIRRGDTEMVRPATLTHPFGQFLSRIAEQNHMGGELSLRRTGFSAVLQHDTVLAPEDCGGPIVDLNGDAVGLNIARAGRTETFALPADVVISVLTSLRSTAEAEPAVAGEEAAPDAPVETSIDSSAQ
ncbi:MAG: PDZ domain-containing protein [Planctomycetaceae bacterium]|nr:PDZ domain-containing protein [Planctomycetaceae bacterium]